MTFAILAMLVACVVLFVALPSSFDRRAQRSSRVRLHLGDGYTVQGSSVAIGAIAAAALALLFVYAIAFLGMGSARPDTHIWSGPLVLFLVLGSLILALETRHRWRWDENGLTFQSAFGSRTIAWEDIVAARQTWLGKLLIEGRRGARIYVSEQAVGIDVVAAAIKRARPDLKVPSYRLWD